MNWKKAVDRIMDTYGLSRSSIYPPNGGSVDLRSRLQKELECAYDAGYSVGGTSMKKAQGKKTEERKYIYKDGRTVEGKLEKIEVRIQTINGGDREIETLVLDPKYSLFNNVQPHHAQYDAQTGELSHEPIGNSYLVLQGVVVDRKDPAVVPFGLDVRVRRESPSSREVIFEAFWEGKLVLHDPCDTSMIGIRPSINLMAANVWDEVPHHKISQEQIEEALFNASVSFVSNQIRSEVQGLPRVVRADLFDEL